MLGAEIEHRQIVIEGGDIASLKEWAEKRTTEAKSDSPIESMSRRQSSDLSSIGESMDGMDFD